MTEQRLYTVGVIVSAHGLRGDVRVHVTTDFPDQRFATGERLLLVHPKFASPIPVTIESSRPQKNQRIVRFNEFQSIDQVEPLKKAELKVEYERRIPLPDGTYYVDDLLGCEVVSDEGVTLGTIVDVLQPGANDVYVVGSAGRQDILLPAIPECILDVDILTKRMRVHVLPGLIDGDD